MKKKPLVTITIPTYNSSHTIALSLQAIKNQTYPHIETIIVDGNSKDTTIKIAKEFKVEKIVKLPGSLLQARYKGVKMAHGEFVLILDSDQILKKDTIEKAVKLFTEKHYDMLVLEETSFNNNTFLEKLFNLDRKLINAVNNLDPFTGVIMPRFFRKSLILQAYLNIPDGMFKNTGGPDHAVVYYESWLLSKKISTVKLAVEHMEPATIPHLWRKFYRWGYTSVDAHYGKYHELMNKKERFRTGLFSKGYFKESIGSITLLVLKGIAFKTGFFIAQVKRKINTPTS